MFIHKSCVLLACIVSSTIIQASIPKRITAVKYTDSLKRHSVSHPFGLAGTKPAYTKFKKIHGPDSTHSPGLAVKRSAIVPGWGQLYNRKWWKVPLAYASIGMFGSSIVKYQREYKQYLAVYRLRKDVLLPRPAANDPVKVLYDKTSGSDLSAIDNAQSNSQRNMQLSVLGLLGTWGLQIVDAYIDAKFIHSYTVDRNLSVNVGGGILTNNQAYAAGNIPAVIPVMKLWVTL